MRNKTIKIIFACLLLFAFASSAAATKPRNTKRKVQRATVEITKQGYQPVSITLRRGILARITFVRKTEATCAKEVVFPEYGIKRELPLDTPVVISFTPNKKGEFTFSCGMDMMRGKLIVR